MKFPPKIFFSNTECSKTNKTLIKQQNTYQTCNCKNLNLAENFLPFWISWVVAWLNIVMFLFLPSLKIFKGFSINPYICRVCTERPSSHKYFWMSYFVLQNLLLYLRKSAKSAINCRILNFPREWFFLNAHVFFPINMLFFRKSAKFSTNCRKMNFFRGWYV